MKAKRAKRGKQPKMVVTSEKIVGEIVDDFLPDDEPADQNQPPQAEPAEAPPPLEKGPWVIRRPPGTALLAELAPKQAEAHEEIRVLQKAIEDSAQRHKELKNKKEKEIAGIEERLDELSREVRFGTTSTVTCWRGREGDEWVYYGDKDGNNELWREPAADGPQQRCCGREVARAGELDELLARAMGFVAPPCELSEVAECELVPWPWGELSWHPFVLARQLELQALLNLQSLFAGTHLSPESYPPNVPLPAPQPPVKDETGFRLGIYAPPLPSLDITLPATEPPPKPEADPAPAIPPGLPPAGTPLTWTGAVGEHGHEYLTGGEQEGYTISRDPSTQKKPGKGGQLRIAYHNRALRGAVLRELFGRYTKVEAAKEAAQQDNDTRLRWPGDVASGLLLNSTGRYQLSRYTVLPGPDGAELWLTQHLPGQDQPAIGLGDHPLADAIAVCQADADKRRAEGD